MLNSRLVEPISWLLYWIWTLQSQNSSFQFRFHHNNWLLLNISWLLHNQLNVAIEFWTFNLLEQWHQLTNTTQQSIVDDKICCQVEFQTFYLLLQYHQSTYKSYQLTDHILNILKTLNSWFQFHSLTGTSVKSTAKYFVWFSAKNFIPSLKTLFVVD